jgi:Amt family ammonium transporter
LFFGLAASAQTVSPALGGISGAVAGLVAITPAAGFVGPMAALLIGLIAGVVCYTMVAKVKEWFGYDDSLDAFGVHGAGGTLGALLTGVFASRYVNPVFKDAQGNATGSGLFDGNAHQLLNQATGVVIAWVLAAAGTVALLKIVDLTVGLRVTEEQEIKGLDLTQHGEEGYSLE